MLAGLVTVTVLSQDPNIPQAALGSLPAHAGLAAERSALKPEAQAQGGLAGTAPRAQEPTQPTAANAFSGEVLRLAADADAIDQLWHQYKLECGVRIGRQYDFGREWFALWDRRAEATLQSPLCQELLWRVGHEGEQVRRGLRNARSMAHSAALDPATEVGMLRWHALQWH